MHRTTAVLAALVLVLGACGDDDTEPSTTAGTAVTTTTPGAGDGTTTAPSTTTTTAAVPDAAAAPYAIGDPSDPLAIDLVPAGETVTAEIGPDGGTVEAVTASGDVLVLTVPPGALPGAVDISLTPAGADPGGDLPGAVTLVGAILEPTGLVFLSAAELAVTPAATAPDGHVGLQAATDGTNAHLAPASAEAGTTRLTVSHFSVFGVVASGPDISRLFAFRVPSGREAQAISLLQWVDAQFEIGSPAYLAERERIVTGWGSSLLAEVTTAAFADDAEVIALIAEVLAFGQRLRPTDAAGQALVLGMLSSLGDAMEAAAARAASRCAAERDPDEAFTILRWWHAHTSIALLVPPGTGVDDGHYRDLLDGCFRFTFVVEVESGGNVETGTFRVEHRADLEMDVVASDGGPGGLVVTPGSGRFVFPTFEGEQVVTEWTLDPAPPCGLVTEPGSITVEIAGELDARGLNLAQIQLPGPRPGIETIEAAISWAPIPATRVTCEGASLDVPTWAPYLVGGSYPEASFSGGTGDLRAGFDGLFQLDVLGAGGSTYADLILTSSFEGVEQTTTLRLDHDPAG